MNLQDGKDVERLNNQEFRSIMNALLRAETGRWNVHASQTWADTNKLDPHAMGTHARVKWSADGHDILKRGENVIQYKSGKLSIDGLRTEFRKRGVTGSAEERRCVPDTRRKGLRKKGRNTSREGTAQPLLGGGRYSEIKPGFCLAAQSRDGSPGIRLWWPDRNFGKTFTS